MAAAVPVADAPPPLTTTVACSNEVMESWGRKWGLPDGLNPDAIRAWRDGYSGTVWHQVADDDCGIDVCEWIKSRGLLDMINLRDDYGWSPLHHVVGGQYGDRQQRELKARWMMANGADVNAVDNNGMQPVDLAMASVTNREAVLEVLRAADATLRAAHATLRGADACDACADDACECAT